MISLKVGKQNIFRPIVKGRLVDYTNRDVFPASVPWITSYTPSSTRNDLSNGVGYKFTIGATSITVTHLGRWIVSGNSGTHRMVITTATATPTILSDSTVNTSGKTPAQFEYVQLSSKVVLSSGTSYYIFSVELSGGDLWYTDVGSSTSVTSVATLNNSKYTTDTTNFTNAVDGTAGVIYVPVNFKYY